MRITKFAIIILLFLVLPSVITPAIGELKIDVFSIHSNVIKSWVQYSIKLKEDRAFANDKPIIAFRKRPSGSVRKLNFFERRYYGIDSQKIVNKDQVDLKIKALPSRIISIIIKKKTINTYINIKGKKCLLEKIMVYSKKGLFSSYTGYVEIHGRDIETNETIKERIDKE